MSNKKSDVVAAALRENKPGIDESDFYTKTEQWARDCEAIASAFTVDSNGFDRVEFLQDCGML